MTTLNSDFYHVSLCSLFMASCRIARCSYELHVDRHWVGCHRPLSAFFCTQYAAVLFTSNHPPVAHPHLDSGGPVLWFCFTECPCAKADVVAGVLKWCRTQHTSSPALVRHREQQMPQLGTILSQFVSVPGFPKFVLILYSDPIPGISRKILPRHFCVRCRNIFGFNICGSEHHAL